MSNLATLAPAAARANLVFTGVGFATRVQNQFQALAGAQPPTVTGGYAKWKQIPRPLQRALTVFDGYDPTTMTVNLIFGQWSADGWDTSNKAGQQVEEDIATLEWMAGGGFHVGPSPVVYVTCPRSDLIPAHYQTVPGRPYPWIVTGLAWGPAHRNAAGFRVWQEATVTLQNYLNVGPPPSPRTTARGGYFVSRPGRDRPILIAAAPTVHSPLQDHEILARRIINDPNNNPCRDRPHLNLAGKSIRFLIPHGVRVFIPQHQTM